MHCLSSPSPFFLPFWNEDLMVGAPTVILEHRVTLRVEAALRWQNRNMEEVCVPEDFGELPYHFWIATLGLLCMTEKENSSLFKPLICVFCLWQVDYENSCITQSFLYPHPLQHDFVALPSGMELASSPSESGLVL